jgi:hypothetical protein
MCFDMTEKLKSYVERFNADDRELYPTLIPNSSAFDWMAEHVPLIDISDKEIEAVYYFRWWTFRKHIVATPDRGKGSIISEFLPPVPWAGKYNSISCAAGHHLKEARWLKGCDDIINSYITYWFQESTNYNDYSNWLMYGVYELCIKRNDFSIGIQNLDGMALKYRQYENNQFNTSLGLFWSECGSDGQEYAVSGDGYRVPCNCNMAANAFAISAIAKEAGRKDIADEFAIKHAALCRAIEKHLWNEALGFYVNKVISTSSITGVARELWGYNPWYFASGVVAPAETLAKRRDCFTLLNDTSCFLGVYGLTTVDRSHPGYAISYKGHECQWNGPVWPFETSKALTALLHVCKIDKTYNILFDKLLKQYAASHYLNPGSRGFRGSRLNPYYIDENMNPDTGDWIARTRLSRWKNGAWDPAKGGEERGKDYNHSTFCDLVLSSTEGDR